LFVKIFFLHLSYENEGVFIKKAKTMNASIEILKRKIENLSPELLEKLSRMVENFEFQNTISVPQFQMEEVLDRLNFHRQNPKTKLDFFENINDLENSFAW